MAEPWEHTDLRQLVGHSECVASDCTLEEIHKRFGGHPHDFMAVIEDGRVLGVCSRHEIGMRLGARYGFSLYYRKPVREFLSPAPILVELGQPVSEVLESVFSRDDPRFYDDVVLVEPSGTFVGLIHIHTLVRLQTGILQDNIVQLEHQKQLIREKNQQMEEDLAMAREMQMAFLPPQQIDFTATEEPDAAPWLKISRLYQPAQKVGGDFIHVSSLGPDSVAVFVADVMGHGVRSALVTAMLRALVEEIGAAKSDPGEFLTELNRELTAILSQTGDMMFATAFYIIVDRASASVRYSRAGHPCPVILRRALQLTEIMECRRPFSGPGLCVFENARYGTAEMSLGDDDIILMFTDGLIEAAEGDGEPFGTEGLREGMLRHADAGVDELVGEIFAAAGQFVHGTPFEDDLCLVGVNFLVPRVGGSPRHLDIARADVVV